MSKKLTGDVSQIVEVQFVKPDYSVTFYRNENQSVGKLDFNGSELVFTGEADASAKVFFHFVAESFSQRLESERMIGLAEVKAQRDELHSALKGLLSYFQSGNSVPVDKATIKADSAEVKAALLALSKVADKL